VQEILTRSAGKGHPSRWHAPYIEYHTYQVIDKLHGAEVRGLHRALRVDWRARRAEPAEIGLEGGTWQRHVERVEVAVRVRLERPVVGGARRHAPCDGKVLGREGDRARRDLKGLGVDVGHVRPMEPHGKEERRLVP
jgi:hypothetical protein